MRPIFIAGENYDVKLHYCTVYFTGAKAVVASMLTDGQTPTHKTYQKLMEGYAMRGDAEEICNLIKQQQLEVDRFMLSHLVMAYLNRCVPILVCCTSMLTLGAHVHEGYNSRLSVTSLLVSFHG